MLILTIIAAVFVYTVIGAVVAAICNRIEPGLPGTLVMLGAMWPITVPGLLLLTVAIVVFRLVSDL